MRTIKATVLLLALVATARAQEFKYRVTDLGALPGGNSSAAYAINNRGQVTGESDVASQGPFYTEQHAFLYSNGQMQDLGVLGGQYSYGMGINDHGVVVGNSTTTSDDSYFIYPFIWSGGAMRNIGSLGGIVGGANAINDQGIVVGSSDMRTGEERAFIYNGTMHDLGTGNGSEATDINNLNQVVGTVSQSTSESSTLVFLWQNGYTRILPTLGGSRSFGPHINDLGFVVGTSTLAGDKVEHAFGYAFGRILDLSPGAAFSEASAINLYSQVVGSYSVDGISEHAFVWHYPAKLQDLNTLIDPMSGWVLIKASSENDLGQIVGEGIHSGLNRAFLLTPYY
jgi:probable HAF family extracellular repeat protein